MNCFHVASVKANSANSVAFLSKCNGKPRREIKKTANCNLRKLEKNGKRYFRFCWPGVISTWSLLYVKNWLCGSVVDNLRKEWKRATLNSIKLYCLFFFVSLHILHIFMLNAKFFYPGCWYYFAACQNKLLIHMKLNNLFIWNDRCNSGFL